jgi:hypothetical protein
MTNCNVRRLTVGEWVGGTGAWMFMKIQGPHARHAEPMKELEGCDRGSGLSSRKAAVPCS